MKLAERREERSAPNLVRCIGTLKNMITVFRLATVKAMGCGQGVISVGPSGGRKKIVA